MNKINKKSGFSMLELVVVMLIMGTLRGIRISKMGGSDVGAKKASMKSDLRGAIARINACYADKLNYSSCTLAANATMREGVNGLDNATLANRTYKISISPDNTLTFVARGTDSTMPSLSIANSSRDVTTTYTYSERVNGITEVNP